MKSQKAIGGQCVMVTYHINWRRILGTCLAFGTLAFATGTSAGTTAYAYDALNRLVKVTFPDGKQVCYDYDKAGNRTQITKVSGTCTPASLAMAATAASLDVASETVDINSTYDEEAPLGDETSATQATASNSEQSSISTE